MATAQDNNDLRATLAISQGEALTGTTRMLTLPTGRIVTVTIPPGVYSGQELRLPGQGMTQPGKPVGTLILTLTVISADEVGSSQMSSEQANMPTFEMPLSPTVAVSSSSPAYPSMTPPPPPGYPIDGGATIPYYPQTPLPVVPAPSPRPRSKTQIVLLTIIALVVIVGAIGLFAGVYVPAHQHALATATASANQTASAQTQVAQANATGTAEEQVVQEITATVTANQTTYTQTLQGSPDLNDSMANPDTYNWDTNTDCYYSNGAYYVKTEQKNIFNYCQAENATYSNFIMRAQWKLVSGDGAGLVFRGVAAKLYEFQVLSDGSYELNAYTGTSASSATTLLSGMLSNFDVSQAHTMAVEANGNLLKIFVDDTYMGTTVDSTSSAGLIGLIAYAGNSTTQVMYTKVQVWKI